MTLSNLPVSRPNPAERACFQRKVIERMIIQGVTLSLGTVHLSRCRCTTTTATRTSPFRTSRGETPRYLSWNSSLGKQAYFIILPHFPEVVMNDLVDGWTCSRHGDKIKATAILDVETEQTTVRSMVRSGAEHEGCHQMLDWTNLRHPEMTNESQISDENEPPEESMMTK
jgi:hypothetical protein